MLNNQRPEKKAREAATQESMIANERDALTNLQLAGPFGEAFASLATNMGKSFNGETDDWHGRPCVTNPSRMSTGILLCRDVPESRQAPKASIR